METNGGTCANSGVDGAAAARASDMPQPKKLFRFAPEKGKEELAALAPTGTLAAIRCKADSCFRLVSVPEGKPISTLPVPGEALPRVQAYFTRDGVGLLCLLPGEEGCGVTLWDVKTGGALWQTNLTEEARRPAVTASFLCMTRKNGYVSVYSLQNGGFVNAFRAHRPICDYDWESPEACVDLYALGGDGLLSCGWDGWLRQWRLCEDGVVAEQRNLICNFALATDEEIAVTVGGPQNRQLYFWNAETGALVHAALHEGAVRHAFACADGRLYCDSGGWLYAWELGEIAKEA